MTIKELCVSNHRQQATLKCSHEGCKDVSSNTLGNGGVATNHHSPQKYASEKSVAHAVHEIASLNTLKEQTADINNQGKFT